MNEAIDDFTIDVPQRQLDDLCDRLERTRWPERATAPAWTQGPPLDYVQDLCRYWANGYDWRRAEAALNAWPHYRTFVDGVDIHFVHARCGQADSLALVLTHGWPGSVVEFLDVLPRLTAAGFDCVVPSLPGYGWSGKPSASGWGITRIARVWATLMSRLGYNRYGAAGTDWGTSISASLAEHDRAHVVGALLVPPLAPPLPHSDRDRGNDHRSENGYSMQQRTRPQTIGYSLTDSPAGLAAWITEKIHSWSDPRSIIGSDAIIDNLMLYWLPRNGASAARLYWESHADVSRWLDGQLAPDDIVHAPVGAAVFPYELQRPTRREAEQRFTDIRYWSEPEFGGHFAAWEQPATFVAEIERFFALIR